MGNTQNINNGQVVLTDEQQALIDAALEGKNVLVDACIGSGKTTTIQYLCEKYPADTSILYLTYSKCLKVDAQSKICQKNVEVTSYHGFACKMLRTINISAGQSDLIQFFLKYASKITIPHYDVLIIDEYQDIMQEFADELACIRDSNPNMQIIAVGDMDQKIYDWTTLDVSKFISNFLGDHISLTFSTCFRLSEDYAKEFGYPWHKKIHGVNEKCVVRRGWDIEKTVEYLAMHDPSEILVLGSNGQYDRANILNTLEDRYPQKFNKHNVWVKTKGDEQATSPDKHSAIFTTYDGSKGLERRICVICDFDRSYWNIRADKPGTKYEILRNIFLVAASRGKEEIIFVKSNMTDSLLEIKDLSENFRTSFNYNVPVNISSMFAHKFQEDVEECYKMLNVFRVDNIGQDCHVISTKLTDGKIDLSPCVGIFAEACFFNKYDIDDQEYWGRQFLDPSKGFAPYDKNQSLQWKILYIVARDTKQDRYIKQVGLPFVKDDARDEIVERLSTVFDKNDTTQRSCEINFAEKPNGSSILSALGRTDVIKDNVIWELKFVSELKHEHFLQLACYLAALNMEKGILWNIRDNTMYAVTIKDKNKFLDSVAKTITKRQFKKYYKPQVTEKGAAIKEHITCHAIAADVPSTTLDAFVGPERNAVEVQSKQIAISNVPEKKNKKLHNKAKNVKVQTKAKIQCNEKSDERINGLPAADEYYAVIDTETSYSNKAISIGVIIADKKTATAVEEYYGIITPESDEYSKFGDELRWPGIKINNEASRDTIIKDIEKVFQKYSIGTIFQYSGNNFDYNHLPEFHKYNWADVINTTAYVQYNPFLNPGWTYRSTGKLYDQSSGGSGVENMLYILTGQHKEEVHNALCDARDELNIIKYLGVPFEVLLGNDAKNKSSKGKNQRKKDYEAFIGDPSLMPRRTPEIDKPVISDAGSIDTKENIQKEQGVLIGRSSYVTDESMKSDETIENKSEKSNARKTRKPVESNDTVEGTVIEYWYCNREAKIKTSNGKVIYCKPLSRFAPYDIWGEVEQGAYVRFVGYYSGKRFYIQQVQCELPIKSTLND